MIRAPTPRRDADRDAAPDSATASGVQRAPLLDRICALAQRLLEVPHASVALLGSDPIWQRAMAAAGEHRPPAALALVARLESGCHPVVVPDTLADERFADNPLVTGFPGIRFYASAPLLATDNEVIGTLSVLDTQPRALTGDQIQTLCDLAAWAASDLERRRTAQEASETMALTSQTDRARVGPFDPFARTARAGVAALPVQARNVDHELQLRVCQRYANVGFWEWDLRGGAIRLSEAVQRLLGIGAALADRLDRDGYIARIHADDRAAVIEAARRCLEDGELYECEYRVEHPDGRMIWVLDRGDVERDDSGRSQRMLGAMQEITPRRLAQAEAERQRAELMAAKEEAERANRAKSEFLSSMSHELRTPLNAILGFAQLLLNSRRDTLSERQRGQVEHITRSGGHLLNLINEVLDLARIEAGQLHLSVEPVSIDLLIDDCLLMVRTMAERRGIQLRARIDPRLPLAALDIVRGKQVLLNLLTNAVKYNRDGGAVVISASVESESGVRVEVRDTGLGIPAQLQGELFKPFCRLGQETGSQEGTGIGLTITRQLVEQMHGQIDFVSTEGEGSVFSVVFPLAAARPTVSDEGQALALNGLAGLTQRAARLLLYIEDNPANLALMRQMIGEAGQTLELITAHTAELGLELARSRQPDLIIMDINLPGITGVEAAQRLKGTPETANIPVVALSANAMWSSSARAERDQVFASTLTKPVNVAALLAALEQHLPRDEA